DRKPTVAPGRAVIDDRRTVGGVAVSYLELVVPMHAGCLPRNGPSKPTSDGRIDATRVASGAGEVHEQVRGSGLGEQLLRCGLDIVAGDHGRAGDHVLVRVPTQRQRPPAQDLRHVSLGVVAGAAVTVDVD